MAGAIREGDLSTSDPCGAPPHAPSSYSGDVNINGKPSVTIGDTYEDHSCPGESPHHSTATGGSSTVKINGKGVHRNGDSISCGSFGDNGSTTVNIG